MRADSPAFGDVCGIPVHKVVDGIACVKNMSSGGAFWRVPDADGSRCRMPIAEVTVVMLRLA